MSDNVNHPPHYTRGGIETIDFIEAKELSWCLGNAVKYISRAGHKGDALEDLEKAAWYLRREIERLGGDAADDESDAIRQRDKQIAELSWQHEAERKQAHEWNDRACKLQDERDVAIAERDEAVRLADVNYRHFMEAVQQRDAARTQVAELTRWRHDGPNKIPDGWFDAACKMQEQRDEARKQVVELTKRLVEAGLLQVTEAQ